jgi:CDP-diacylglycerol---glycerol-3-phosphate 3-phosphatidyltransferase
VTTPPETTLHLPADRRLTYVREDAWYRNRNTEEHREAEEARILEGREAARAWAERQGTAFDAIFTALWVHGGSYDNFAPGIEYLKKLHPNVISYNKETSYNPSLRGEIPIWIHADGSGYKMKHHDGGPVEVVIPCEGSTVFPLNVPNVLTVLRIVAVPVLVVALLGETPNGDTLAAIVFALAAVTDGLDGYIARSRGDVTTFGKLMDPLADKLLIVAALVSLGELDRLAACGAMVIIARELAVTGLRSVAAEQGVVIAASWLGKLKTSLQVAAIFALIIWEPAPAWVDGLVYLAVAVTVISGVDYFFGLRRRIEAARRATAAQGLETKPR